MPSSSGEFLFKGCPKNLLSLMTFLPEAWKLLSRLVNWQVWSIWNLLCIRISDCEKNYQQRHLAGVNFCFTKCRKNLLILMTFLPECRLELWKLLSMLVYCRYGQFETYYVFVSVTVKKSQQSHLLEVASFEERGQIASKKANSQKVNNSFMFKTLVEKCWNCLKINNTI